MLIWLKKKKKKSSISPDTRVLFGKKISELNMWKKNKRMISSEIFSGSRNNVIYVEKYQYFPKTQKQTS